MKVGLVPLVTDLPSGIPKIIQDGQNGYKFLINSPGKYSSAIKILHKNRGVLINYPLQNELKENVFERIS